VSRARRKPTAGVSPPAWPIDPPRPRKLLLGAAAAMLAAWIAALFRLQPALCVLFRVLSA
jgi:hypothetical protein